MEGDPFNYLVAMIKLLKIELSNNVKAETILLHGIFPYDNNIFKNAVKKKNLQLISIIRRIIKFFLYIKKIF